MPDASIPAGTTLLVKGGRALTPDTDWHDPPQADIAIAGYRIVGVGPSYRRDNDRSVEVIEARDHLLLPGFVNAHYHSHDVLAKGTLEEVPLETWRLYALPPQYPPRSAEEVLRANTARCPGVLAIRDDDDSGHVDALSL